MADADTRTPGSAVAGILTLLGPGTVTVGILYYFGWARTHALFAYFGIDPNVLDLSTPEYVLRSADILWPALTAIVVVILLAASLRAEWIRLARRRIVVAGCAAAGSALLVLALLDLLLLHLRYPFLVPLEIIAAVVLLDFARTALRRMRSPLAASPHPPVHRRAETQVLLIFVLLNAFWAVSLFADQSGQGRAEHLEATRFAEIPDVVLYSRDRLHVDAANVEETDLGKDYQPYRYRYSGLKLLVRTARASVLIPYSWSTGNAYAVVLRTDADVLITFAPHF
jgi:hypothetical protein